MPELDQEATLNIGQYLQTLMFRKWWLIGGLFSAWLIVTLVSWGIPSKYVSQALILIQRQELSDKVVPPNVQIDLQQQLDTMTQQVLSRSNLKKIIEKFSLYPKERKSTMIDDVVDLMRKDIDIELVVPGQSTKKNAELTGFTVSYSGPTPQTAQQVTQELASLFIRENISTVTESNQEALDFLQTELDQAGKDLAAQEVRLKEFKTQYLGQLPEQLQSNLQIMSVLQSRLQQANDGLSRAQQQELYLQSLLSQYGSGVDNSGPGSALQAIDQRLTTMKAELADLRAKYTDQHPDVVHLQHDIAATETLKKTLEQPSGDSGASGSGGTQGLTSLAQVKSQLKANELEIANRKKDVKEVESEIAQYQGRLNLTPVREQELANIERDHQQSLANYNSLLAKKQASALAANLVNRQQGDQLQLVDPASLPDKPSFPNHLKFSVAGVGVGLLIGLVLVAGRELTAALIYNEDQAANIVNAPILTAIPSLATVSEKSKSRRVAVLRAVAAALLLSIIPAGIAFAFLKG